MSSEELSAFFHEQVLRTYQDFVDRHSAKPLGNSQDLRAALLAALALYHFREHLDGDLTISVDEVVRKCPDYALLRDVADIAKHRTLDRPSAVLRTTDTVQELMVITIYRDELGEYQDCRKAVELTLPDGTRRELRSVLIQVLKFWRGHLVSHGVSLLERELGGEERREPLSREECSERGLSLSIVRGLRWKCMLRLQRYNYEKREVESINLTGRKAQFLEVNPKSAINVNVALVNDQTGEKVERSVTLTPEQTVEFAGLGSDEARREYVSEVPQVREAYESMAAEVERRTGKRPLEGEPA